MYRFPVPVTMGNASAHYAACVAAIDGGESEVALDALVHSDSSAVAIVLAAIRHAERAGRTIRFTGAPASLHSLATLYGVDGLLTAGTIAPVPSPTT